MADVSTTVMSSQFLDPKTRISCHRSAIVNFSVFILGWVRGSEFSRRSTLRSTCYGGRALHSGAIAGEAVIESFRYNRPIQQVYRAMIASEVRNCSDQWNPLKIIFNRPHEAEFRGVFKKLSSGDQVKMVWKLILFIRIYGCFKWGRQIIQQTIYRLFNKGYSSGRWL